MRRVAHPAPCADA
ncbi:Protein of unknown function [Escherichia coli D6-113.11]|nr:Protein of unknown function [Escherichia coli D6-113.11]CDU35200.1 Protein of unknown function [Escherichia coli D6-113.11]